MSRREEIEQAPWAGYHSRVRPLATDRDPWKRQPREGAWAYAMFAVYRDLGPVERSQREAVRRVGRSLAFIQRLSVRWQRVFRAEQWDAHQDG